MIRPRLAIPNVEKRWKIAQKCDRFMFDLDHGKHYPGGISLGVDIKIIANDRTKYNWYPKPSMLNYHILHIEWCIRQCNGKFFRMRDPEIIQSIITKNTDDPHFNTENIMMYMIDAPLSIMTFSDPNDALRFKFALDYI